MRDHGESFDTTKFNEIELQSHTTLLDIFQSGSYISTSVGRNGWLGLIANSELQPNCNKEGFNIDIADGKVRLGIIGNNENDCIYPDSALGFGTGGCFCYCITVSVSSGVFTKCHTNDMIKSTIGYIFVRK